APAAEAPAPAAPPAEAPPAPTAEAPAPAPEAPAAEAPAADAPAPAAEAPAEEAPAAPAQSEPAPTAAAADAPASGSRAGYITPIVRKLASEKGVELGELTGTGVGGRIRKQDVLAAASGAAAPATQAPAAAAAPAVEVSPLRGTTVPMTRLRKVVAERAVVSMNSTAQLTTVVEADVTKIAALRSEVKDDFLAKT